MEDSQIIDLLNKRDETAVTALMDKYGGLCRGLIGNVLTDRRDIEECLNGVMFRLWSAIPPARPENLMAYAAKTARNEALTRARTLKTKEGLDSSLEEMEFFLPAVQNESRAFELRELISLFLSGQTKLRRDVFIRRYWYFESNKEIAKRYSVSESKITSLLFRTRNALRNHLEKEGFFDE